MTTKTEILYRPKTMLAKASLEIGMDNNFEPVTVHVAGDLYRKIEEEKPCHPFGTYEKVTHVLPDQFRDSTKQMETSDDYEYVLLKVGDEISEGDEIWNREDGQWQSYSKRSGCLVEYDTNPIRRRVSKSEADKGFYELYRDGEKTITELQKKVEELESTITRGSDMVESQVEDEAHEAFENHPAFDPSEMTESEKWLFRKGFIAGKEAK